MRVKSISKLVVFVLFLSLITELLNIPVNAETQISNGSFETPNPNDSTKPANWNFEIGGGAQVTFDYRSDGGYDGSRYMRISNNSPTASGLYGRMYQSVAVQPNTVYVITLRYRTTNANGCVFGGGPNTFPYFELPKDTGGQWKTITRTLYTESETSREFVLYIYNTVTQCDVDLISYEAYGPMPKGTVTVNNPSFETASGSLPGSWTTTSNGGAQAAFDYRSDGGFDGSRYMRITNSSSLSPNVFGSVYQDISVEPNTTYTISLRAKTVNANDCWFGGGPGWNTRFYLDKNTNGLWKRFTGTFTTGSETTWKFMVNTDNITQQLDIDMINITPAVSIDYNTNLGTANPVYQGINQHPGWEFPSSWVTQKSSDLLKAININKVRLSGQCEVASTSEGVYDWTFVDKTADIVYHEEGAQALPFMLGYSPKWLSSNSAASNYNIYPPADNVKFAQICEDYVKHYNQGWDNGYYYNIKYWEIWNEPDIPAFWNGTLKQYCELYKTATTRLKALDSTLKVGGPAFGWCDITAIQEFLDYVKDNNVPLDFISFHRYASDVDIFDQDLYQIKLWLSQRGLSNVEIIIDEYNNSLDEDHRDYNAAEKNASTICHMVKQGVSEAMRYKDKEEWLPHYGLEPSNNFGYINVDDTPRKAYFAYKAFDMLNQTNTLISATGSMGNLDVIAGKNTSTNEVTIIAINKADDIQTTQLSMKDLNFTGSWTETHYRISSNYDWQVAESSAHSAAGNYTRALDLPARSITVIRLESGSNTKTVTSKDIDLVSDAHNAKWQTGDYELNWDTLRDIGIPYTCQRYLNLMNNDSFENGLWASRTGSNIFLDSSTYYNGYFINYNPPVYEMGTKSVRFESTASEQYMLSDAIKVNPRQDYRLELMLKTENISTADGFSVRVLPIDATGNALDWYPYSTQKNKLISTGGTQDWKKYSVDVTNIDPRATAVKVYLVLDGNVSGSAWADCVRFWTYNYEFEGTTEYYSPQTWNPGNWARDASVYSSGNASVKTTSTNYTQSISMTTIPVDPTSKYSLSAYIKTDGVSADGVSINLLQIDSNGNSLGWYNTYKLISTGGTHGFEKIEVPIDSLNPNTTQVRMYLRMDANAGGAVWFDDVMFLGSKGINGYTNKIRMEDGTLYDRVLATGVPWKTSAAYINGTFKNFVVPTTGTVTVHATGGFKDGCTGQSATFSLQYYDYETGTTGTLSTVNHTYNGSLFNLSANLDALKGKKIDIIVRVSTASGENADGAAWTAADITGM